MFHIATICIKVIFWFCIVEVLYSYFLYPAILGWFCRLFPRPIKASSDYEPSVAIVIPVHNEEKVIREKLRNCLCGDYPAQKLSVWVGSDCSTDSTESIVKEFGDPRVHLWVAPSRSGKAGVLNQLVPLVDAEIIVFTDADIIFDERCIRNLVNNFADTSVGGVGGLTIQRENGLPVNTEETEYRMYEAQQKSQEALLHSTISAFGPLFAIRKTLYVPFHPHTYSNDDVMLPMNIVRQKYRMFFNIDAISYEEVQSRMEVEFSRRVRIGAGNFQAFFWLLDFLNPLKGWPWFCYVSHKVSRWFSPLFIILGLMSCAILSFFSNSLIYDALLISGMMLAAAGLLHRYIPLKSARRIFYFMMMNAALVLGFFRFLRGIRTAAWTRTERG